MRVSPDYEIADKSVIIADKLLKIADKSHPIADKVSFALIKLSISLLSRSPSFQAAFNFISFLSFLSQFALICVAHLILLEHSLFVRYKQALFAI